MIDTDRVLNIVLGAFVAVVLLVVGGGFVDSVFANVTTSPATVVELFVEQEGGLHGGTDHIVVVQTNDGRRIGVYVGYQTYYSLVVGQKVTLEEKRGKWTGWYVKDRISH